MVIAKALAETYTNPDGNESFQPASGKAWLFEKVSFAGDTNIVLVRTAGSVVSMGSSHSGPASGGTQEEQDFAVVITDEDTLQAQTTNLGANESASFMAVGVEVDI